MTFSTTDLPKMAMAAVVAAGLTASALFHHFHTINSNLQAQVNHYKNQPDTLLMLDLNDSGSARISWSEARTLKNRYDSVPFVNAYNENMDNTKPLKGFEFKARQLDSIINNNTDLPLGAKADKVIFYFGLQPDTTIHNVIRKRAHLIAVGVKADTLLNDDRTVSVIDKMAVNKTKAVKFAKNAVTGGVTVVLPASVYDKAKPCPPCAPQQ